MKHPNWFSLMLVGLGCFLLGILIASPPTALRAFEPSARATPTISKKMNAHQVDNVHAAKTPVKNRLLALDTNAKFPLSAMPDGLQRRVSGNCVVGSAVRAVNPDGSVVCETIPARVPTPTAIVIPSPVPTPTANPADITGVIAGNGLKGGGISGDVTLSAAFSSDGYVKAGVHAFCGNLEGPSTGFNAVNGAKIIVLPGEIEAGTCTIDFGFSVENRFIVATGYEDDYHGVGVPRMVTIASKSGSQANFLRVNSNGNGLNGFIDVLVY